MPWEGKSRGGKGGGEGRRDMKLVNTHIQASLTFLQLHVQCTAGCRTHGLCCSHFSERTGTSGITAGQALGEEEEEGRRRRKREGRGKEERREGNGRGEERGRERGKGGGGGRERGRKGRRRREEERSRKQL